MKFYIMYRGLFEEIPFSEIRHQATVFIAEDRRSLRRVKFSPGKYADDTKFGKVEKLWRVFNGKLKIKVCGPAVFFGRPIEVEKVGGSSDYYLETEITPRKLYCLSWIANYPDKDAICISFEILKEKKRKK